MSGSGRKRKSQWDSKEVTHHSSRISEDTAGREREGYSNVHDSHGPRWSDLEDNDALKTKDITGWPSWESSQENYSQKDDSINRDMNQIPVATRSGDGDKTYSRSPGHNEWARDDRSRSPKSTRSLSRRYRSRSRSRDQGLRRSRSRSRSRSGHRDRDDKKWSRSRSQSRSPVRDYRRESYERSDRKSGSGSSFQPCRDFVAGRCRRGSQCRFPHQDNFSQRDGGQLEKDQAERWRRREEHGEGLKYTDTNRPQDYPPDKVFDGYGNHSSRDKDDSLRNYNTKPTIICNDFVRGKCHRGSSCRYPHHDASANDHERRSGNASFDHDHKRPMRRGGCPPCKYFAMGKCQRNDCRFSHDPVSGDFEKSSRDDRDGYSLGDRNKSWNGPTWDDVESASDIPKSSGWGDSNIRNMNHEDKKAADKQDDEKWVQNLDDMNKSWDAPKLADVTGTSDVRMTSEWAKDNAGNVELFEPTKAEKQSDEKFSNSLDNYGRMSNTPVYGDKVSEMDGGVSHQWGNVNNGSNMGGSESTGGAELRSREESQLVPQGPDSQTLDQKSPHLPVKNRTQAAAPRQQLATAVLHPGLSENRNIRQQGSQSKENITRADDPGALNSVNISGNVSSPSVVAGLSFNQNGDSMGPRSSSLVGGGNVNTQSPLNGQNVVSNGPMQQMLSHVTSQDPSQRPFGMLEPNKLLQVNSVIPPNVVTSEQVAQRSDISASLMQILGNGQLPQLYAALNRPNSSVVVPSLSNSASVAPPNGSSDCQPDPAIRSEIQYDPFGDSLEPNNTGNGSELQEQVISMSLELPSRPPIGELGHVEPKKSGGSGEECDEIMKQKQQQQQQKPISVSEGDIKQTAEKSKQDGQNNPSENVNTDGKAGEGNGGKDDKDMRLFKIALVDFVKEILKPRWKEGHISREVHKTIVKKVVDKVTSTIQGVNVPRTQERIDQYLSFSKPKITKLVEAYTERFLKS